MTISSFDPIAVWYFNSNNQNIYYNPSNIEFGCYPIQVFWNLRKALKILKDSKILLINKLTFLGSDKITIEIKEKDISVDRIMDIIVNGINNNTSPSIRFTGSTILFDGGLEEEHDDIVQFYCGLNSGDFSVTLFSDCWVPIDRDDNLQIELAEKNSPNLSRVLSQIKSLGFDSINPDVNEEYIDELLPQCGFKVYLYDSALDFLEDTKISKEDIKCIKKYLWKNRTCQVNLGQTI